jgi:hypothetical protein
MKRTLIILLAVLILIQLIRPALNVSTVASANDIHRHYPVPDTVLKLLQRSCYDCHSNNTVYPWYDKVQPVAWWLQYHVNHGKRGLNFSEFWSYTAKRKVNKLKSISEEIKSDDMPLGSYLWIHTYAKLNDGDKSLITHWADSLRDVIAPDTLAQKGK